MPIKAGQIVIDVTAGTSKFVVDMENAKAKIREFGSTGSASMRETNAVIRSMEGNFANNNRAAASFFNTVLGGGAIVKAAFPVVGALAFAGVIDTLGRKVYDFFKEMKEAPEKIGAAFRSLNDPLRTTNDQLAVANARLENDIAKLEGKRQNTLKVALLEATEAADKLADSLDKDLASLNKLLKEQNVSFWRKLFGEAGTSDLKDEFGGDTGQKGFIGQVNSLTDAGNEKIRAATDAKTRDSAQTELNTKLLKLYGDEIGKVNGLLDKANADNVVTKWTVPGYMGIPTTITTGGGQDARISELQGIVRQLRYEKDSVSLQGANTALTQHKDALTTANENAVLDRPFQDRMKALGVQLDGIKAKLTAIGQPESAQIMAKAFGEAQKAIEEVNRSLEKHHTQLTADQKAQIGTIEQSIASAEAETTWKEHLASTATTINDRIRSQELLTAAIGRGYEATKRANVETQLMGALGQHFNDSEWMQGHQGDVSGLRDKFGAEYDAKHGEAVAVSIQKLKEQTELERSLAQVQSQGAEAVRLVTLAYQLRSMVAEGATRAQIQAEIQLFNATRENASATALAGINQKITATERLTAAVFKGAEAQRLANLENKYAEMAHNGATPAEVAAEKTLDQAEYQQKVTQEVGKTVTAYRDQIDHLNELVAVIEKEKKDHGDTLELEIALRDIENERLRIAVQQELKIKGAKDGLKAFFLEMQESAKSAADIIYESLNSALDKTSDQFAKLLTHQKTDFGKMFQGIGQEMVKSSVKSMMQKGLGELGKVFGIHPPAGKPDGSAGNPYHVIVDGNKGTGSPDDKSGSTSALGGLSSGIGGALNGAFGAVAGFLGKLFGGGGGGGGTDVSSTISYGGAMAEGGDVYPGNAYTVAEAGEFEIFQPKGPGTITPAHKLGGNNYTYHVDARGSELGVEGRVEAAIRAAHNSAVEQGVKASAERLRRSPQRSGG